VLADARRKTAQIRAKKAKPGESEPAVRTTAGECHGGADPVQSAQALRQFWESVKVELWCRAARLRCMRLLFAENERSLKNHAGELFRRPYVRSYLPSTRSLKLQLKFMVAAEDSWLPFGVPFCRDGRGESISVNFASAVVGHDAITAPD
jgi:hypothetical protein